MDVVLTMQKYLGTNGKNGRSKEARVFLVGTAVFFLGCGVLAPIAGLILIIIHSAMSGETALGNVGTAAMIISIPMLLVGAHLLDLLESKQ